MYNPQQSTRVINGEPATEPFFRSLYGHWFEAGDVNREAWPDHTALAEQGASPKA